MEEKPTATAARLARGLPAERRVRVSSAAVGGTAVDTSSSAYSSAHTHTPTQCTDLNAVVVVVVVSYARRHGDRTDARICPTGNVLHARNSFHVNTICSRAR